MSVAIEYVRGQIGVETYWAAVSAPLSLAKFCLGNDAWEVEYLSAVHSGFWRLHALDRKCSFWKNTNHLATWSKLGEFANFELANNPTNCDAARLAIATALLDGASHLEVSPWRALVDSGTADFRFLVFSAFATASYWTDENIGQLTSLVRVLARHIEVLPALHELAERDDEAAKWVNRVKLALAV